MAFQPEKVSCSICHDVYDDPVVLSCSHSFCEACIKTWYKENPGKSCPICRRKLSRKDPIRNLALRDAVEALRRIKPEEFCRLHSQKLQLYCLHDELPVCVVCKESKTHELHHFRPIEEAAQDLRVELEEGLTQLRDKLKLLQQFEKNCDLSLGHINSQASQAKELIQNEIEKLHQFLVEEEESRMKALREEEEQKTQRMKDKMAAVSREIEVLSESIRATEEQLRAPDVSFLLKYKATVERAQRCPLLEEEPQLGPEALIDQAKHLGNLTFNIWNDMKKLVLYSPVILDPNTAHPELVLSNDLTSLTLGEEQKLPQNPERVRIENVEMVRGSVGFNSGSHSWSVEVGDCEDWELGVVTDSAYYILDEDEVGDNTGWWSITFKDGEYKTFTADKRKGITLKVRTILRRIRVHLECNKRKLTFYDADTNRCLHCFVQIHQQKLFPVFVSGSEEPITILPQIICLSV